MTVTDCKWMRGIDYRSKAVKMTLLIGRSFENYHDAIQGFYRVGRFDDKCQRIIFKDVKVVAKQSEMLYLKSLMQFYAQMATKPVAHQPVVVTKLAPPTK